MTIKKSTTLTTFAAAATAVGIERGILLSESAWITVEAAVTLDSDGEEVETSAWVVKALDVEEEYATAAGALYSAAEIARKDADLLRDGAEVYESDADTHADTDPWRARCLRQAAECREHAGAMVAFATQAEIDGLTLYNAAATEQLDDSGFKEQVSQYREAFDSGRLTAYGEYNTTPRSALLDALTGLKPEHTLATARQFGWLAGWAGLASDSIEPGMAFDLIYPALHQVEAIRHIVEGVLAQMVLVLDAEHGADAHRRFPLTGRLGVLITQVLDDYEADLVDALG